MSKNNRNSEGLVIIMSKNSRNYYGLVSMVKYESVKANFLQSQLLRDAIKIKTWASNVLLSSHMKEDTLRHATDAYYNSAGNLTLVDHHIRIISEFVVFGGHHIKII